MTTINKKKLTYSLWSLVYLALTIAIVVSSVSLFNNFYYESVYVSGGSMNPIFAGNGDIDRGGERFGSDYGIIDKNSGAKRNVKRFQIVTTYYPGDPIDRDNATYKIKRVLVKPGERFKIVDNDLYIYDERHNSWGDALEMPFVRNGIDNVESPLIYKNVQERTLKNDEYFLAGDNWTNSYDSFEIGPISYDLLVGVVVKMQGRCTIKQGKVVEKQTYDTRYFLGVDY